MIERRPGIGITLKLSNKVNLDLLREFLSNRIGASKRDIWMRAGNVIASSLKILRAR